MKRKIAAFGLVAMLMLSVILINVSVYEAKGREIISGKPIKAIVGALGIKVGYSIDSGQAIVGRNGWLFLGDDYSHILSMHRGQGFSSNRAKAQEIADNLHSWQGYFRDHANTDFTVLLFPEKSTIYSKYLPSWMDASSSRYSTLTDELVGLSHLAYAKQLIQDSNSNSKNPLTYYKTDTHWNQYGGYLGYVELMKSLKQKDSQLKSVELTAKDFIQQSTGGGDLARFLSAEKFVKDLDYSPLLPDQGNVIESEYLSGKVVYKGEPKMDSAPEEWLLVSNPHALNKSRVLVLRDSFDTVVSRYMTRTFSQTLQKHYSYVSKEDLKKIVAEFQPDLVIVLMVERALVEPIAILDAP